MFTVNETFMSETETRSRRLTLHPRRDRDETFTKTFRDRDETETFDFLFETRPRRDVPKSCPRRDRDNLKQYLSSHNLDAIDHHHGCFINSYNTLVPCIWYNGYNLKDIIVGLCAVCIINESIIVNSIQSSCWSLPVWTWRYLQGQTRHTSYI